MSKIKYRYMLVNYIQRPKYPARTHEKGYWSNPENSQWDEVVEFSVSLKKRDYNNSIIMNLDELQVVKNTMNGEKDFAKLFSYYQDHYGQQIADYLKRTSNVVLQ